MVEDALAGRMLPKRALIATRQATFHGSVRSPEPLVEEATTAVEAPGVVEVLQAEAVRVAGEGATVLAEVVVLVVDGLGKSRWKKL